VGLEGAKATVTNVYILVSKSSGKRKKRQEEIIQTNDESMQFESLDYWWLALASIVHCFGTLQWTLELIRQ
jgi:hypothetical protein